MAEQERLNKAVLDAHAAVETALRASEARFRAVFAGAAIGIGIADMDGRIVQVNPAFCQLLGYSVEEMCRLNVSDLAHPEDIPGMWELYAEMVRGQRDHVRMDKAYYRKDGGVVWTDLSVSLVRDDAGAPRFTVAMLTNVTERHRLQQRLRYQALHDPLTGLPNRAMAAERLEEMLAAPDPQARLVCATWTWTDSNGSTTRWATMWVTSFWWPWRAASRSSPRRTMCWSPGWAATSSCCWLSDVAGTEQMAVLAGAILDTLAPPFQVGPHDSASPPASASSNAGPPTRPTPRSCRPRT